MKKWLATLTVTIILFTNVGYSQQLFTNTNIQTAYKNQTRTDFGKPGKNYWQNFVNYQIKVNFDPSTQLLQGNATISYENNSLDTLKEIIIRLYPDLYKKGVQRLSYIAEKDLNDGVQIESFRIGEESITNFQDRRKVFRRNTLLYIRPPQPLLPHSKTTVEIGWNYKVNTGSPVRTVMVDSTTYFIAYFFPRLSVYDDIEGWDTWSYNGSQEFYNDFGNFNVEITVPKTYTVWATGDRENTEDNFNKNVLEKIKKASVQLISFT